MGVTPTVFILDDDESFLSALGRLLHNEGFQTQAWSSATRFLAEFDPQVPGCLLVDLMMPDMSGLELQTTMLASGCIRPIVFMTGRGDMSTTVIGMRAGAISFLAKPVHRGELVAALQEAIAKDARVQSVFDEQKRIAVLLHTLTPRERQVLELVAQGLLNKQIAGALGAAEKTIKVHRGRVLCKMQVRSATALNQLMARAALPPFERPAVVPAGTHRETLAGPYAM